MKSKYIDLLRNRGAEQLVYSRPTQPRPLEGPVMIKHGANNCVHLALVRHNRREMMPTTLVDWTRLYRACGLRRTEEYPGRILINLQIRKKITFETISQGGSHVA
jgi:hypothetical protein